MTSRVDKFTVQQKKIEYFSDFLLNLDKNPLTGNLARVTNEDSIKQSLKTLLLTERTERFFQPWIGSKLNGLLFELHTPLTDISIEQEIKTTIENCEPRVTIEQIFINSGQQSDNNTIDVTINFSINNIPNQIFDLSLVINRVR